MIVKDTYISKNKKDYEEKRNLIHRRCVLIINAKNGGK